MKAGKIIKIFQKVGYYEGWEDDQKSSKRLIIIKAGKMIKIFQKVDYFEDREDYQNLPKGWLS